tara:strand:- start:1481 stop:1885 length:405 start_codon:yes stop_codon:yes gene_type:complete
MSGRFAEKLVVKEAKVRAHQLVRRHEKGRVPEDVVKSGPYPPRSQGMKKDPIRVSRFVGMVLIKKFPALVGRVDHFLKLICEGRDLLVVEKRNPMEITLFPKVTNLFLAQSMIHPLLGGRRLVEQVGQAAVVLS